MCWHADLLIIGGGINGATIARDAAGRGLTVVLAERDDFGGATSSASSKLIHGGLRYLEQRAFRLVRESLHERAVMLRIAPHLVRKLRFILPVAAGSGRPAALLRFGLFLYDALAGSARLEPAGRIPPAQWSDYAALDLARFRALLHYPDCQVDDSRLVLETLLDARARGADIRRGAEVVAIHPGAAAYTAEILQNGHRRLLSARIVVNAAGPWADGVLARLDGAPHPARRLRLVRGSHIVVRRGAACGEEAYTLQNPDGRVVFVLPWLEKYHLIGTTDIPQASMAEKPVCSAEEEAYLLDAHNAAFRRKLGPGDIVWRFAGVRPLVDDGAGRPSEVTRDYRFDLIRHGAGAFLSVFGGKLTTSRLLAENALARLRPLLPGLSGNWTATAPLPGGALPRAALETLWREGPDILLPAIRRRWCFTYGAVAAELFDMVRSTPRQAREIVPGIPEIELAHAAGTEEARSGEDFLYRRTKLFLDLSPAERETVDDWFGKGAAH